MKMHKHCVLPMLVFAATFVRFGSSQECLAGIVTSHTHVTGYGSGVPGTSLQFSGTASYNNLTFHWYHGTHGNVAATPSAEGNVYLLSQRYDGKASNLSLLTPGFIAKGVDAGTVYEFPSWVTVYPNAPYFIYNDVAMYNAYENPGTYSGGESWGTWSPGANFVHQPSYDRAFSLQGGTVPEPSALILLATGALGLLAYGWRRRK